MMKTHPILFNGSMVRAILEGKKTQTRRVIKNPSKIESDDNFEIVERCDLITGKSGLRKVDIDNPYLWPEIYDHHRKDKECDNYIHLDCPYGQTGGLIWVRENIRYDSVDDKNKPSEVIFPATISYEATDQDCLCGGRLRPSIHMPRIASRITLEIKDIRVERLQGISEEDATAEGCVSTAIENKAGDDYSGAYASENFAELWQSINGPESWDENPWVWVVEFEPHQCNIDDYLK